jgi:hypothetical protein
MNKRIYKKKVKKKFGIKTIPRRIDIKWADSYLTSLQNALKEKIEEKLDRFILYGDIKGQEHE